MPHCWQFCSIDHLSQAVRPDIDERRTEMLRTKGFLTVELRKLEDNLLTALSEGEGNLLENNTLIATMERLKTEAETISQKMIEINDIMQQLSLVPHNVVLIENVSLSHTLGTQRQANSSSL